MLSFENSLKHMYYIFDVLAFDAAYSEFRFFHYPLFTFLSFILFHFISTLFFYIEYHEQKTAVYFILDFMINAMDPPLYFGIKFGKCLYTTFYLSRLREKGNKIYITGGYVWPKFSFTCGLEWYLQNSSLRNIV